MSTWSSPTCCTWDRRAWRRWRSDSFVLRPDLVVEVSSPSTRRLELTRKRELYERFGVPEYWFVDLDADRVEVYRLEGERFGPPVLFGMGDTLEPPPIGGFRLAVEDLLG